MAFQDIEVTFTSSGGWTGSIAIDEELTNAPGTALVQLDVIAGFGFFLVVIGSDFIDEVEQNPAAFTFISGGSRVVLSGPDAPGNAFIDATGPDYFWEPPNLAGILDFVSGQTVTMRIDDGAGTTPGEWADLITNPTQAGEWADLVRYTVDTEPGMWADLITNPTQVGEWAEIVSFEPPTAPGEWADLITNPTQAGEWADIVSFEPPTSAGEWADIVQYTPDFPFILHMETPTLDMQELVGDGYEVRVFWAGPPPQHRYLGHARVRAITRSDGGRNPAPVGASQWPEVDDIAAMGDFRYIDHIANVNLPETADEIRTIIPVHPDFMDSAGNPQNVWMLGRLERADRDRHTYPDPRIANNRED